MPAKCEGLLIHALRDKFAGGPWQNALVAQYSSDVRTVWRLAAIYVSGPALTIAILMAILDAVLHQNPFALSDFLNHDALNLSC